MPARILIIEDNLSNRELMAYLLGAFGHQVAQAEDGRTGLDAAGKGKFDVILCDVQLPDLAGEQVAREISCRSDGEYPPLIAVTALAMLGDRERLLAAGFDGYITKPIEPTTFVQEVLQIAHKDSHRRPR